MYTYKENHTTARHSKIAKKKGGGENISFFKEPEKNTYYHSKEQS